MAVLRKFKALRPKKGLEEKVASYPYDVLNSEEARDLVQGNPYSFLHVVKPEVDLPEGTDLYAGEVYNKAKENFQKFITEGVLIQEDSPRLYIYRQTMEGREQYGIVGCVSVDDYNEDIIKKHEHTRPVKEKDRMRHVDVTNANAGPVFLTYRAKDSINHLVKKAVQETPVYDFTATDGIGHTVWIIEDEVLSDSLIQEFARVDYLYVADGHHRSASAAGVANKRREVNPYHKGDEEYNFFLAVLFPDEQLRILDYNRVLKDLNGHTRDELFAELEKIFLVGKLGDKPYKPQKKGEYGMYFEKTWYKLTVKEEYVDHGDPVDSLDIAMLQSNLLGPFFGIDDPRSSDNINFVGGIRGLGELVKLVDSGKYAVAFALYPVSVKELMAIADAGRVMPPKSTWFEPKLRSGLLVHLLE
ncbi:MAG: DUF1015 domain-containing protein [Candidatus Aminicenantes bacterium]|nr:DUF1015 domain-containing protein [Candidatus Aminicenantes bacterium]